MKALLAVAAVALVAVAPIVALDKKPKEDAKVTSPLDLKVTGIDGKEVDLATYKGKVVLFVNVASKCGYTPQYKGLQELYEKNEKAGLVVIGVPSNDFGGQEPGTNDDVKEFCTSNYKVTFPLLAKVAVKGDKKCDLYKFFTSKDTNPTHGGEVGWNFEKFLVSRKGEVVGHFKSSVSPESETLTKAIAAQLEAK